ncbi:MAG: hypothetical protein R3Y43_06515 [Alphaproteobacteria bacterium]
MKKTKLITGGIIGLTFLLNTSLASAIVDGCNVSTSCQELGYKKQTCDNSIKCPFDPSYAYCQAETKYGITSSWACYDHTLKPVGIKIEYGSTVCVELEENSASFSGATSDCKEKGWYLPSLTELKIIYENKDTINRYIESNDGETLYQKLRSSNQADSQYSHYLLDMKEGTTTTGSSGSRYHFRCLKKF